MQPAVRCYLQVMLCNHLNLQIGLYRVLFVGEHWIYSCTFQYRCLRRNLSIGFCLRPFQLLGTFTSSGDDEYVDHNVTPRTSYFYKLRAVSATETSSYSETREFKSESDFYNPDLSPDYPLLSNVQVMIVDQYRQSKTTTLNGTLNEDDYWAQSLSDLNLPKGLLFLRLLLARINTSNIS
jgi:hypothetical protein